MCRGIYMREVSTIQEGMQTTRLTRTRVSAILQELEDIINQSEAVNPEEQFTFLYHIDGDGNVYVGIGDADDDLLEAVVAAFVRGHSENGWEWRSPQSIADEIEENLDDVITILGNNDVFVASRNGQKYRYTALRN